MDEQERLNALDVALNNEMREREFYLNNAKRTKNEVGRAMFYEDLDETTFGSLGSFEEGCELE